MMALRHDVKLTVDGNLVNSQVTTYPAFLGKLWISEIEGLA
jgi:hypothetical protein